MSFESVCCIKTIKSRLSKTFENKKIAGTVLFTSWLATDQWNKII